MSGLFLRPYDGHATRANVRRRMMKTRSVGRRSQKKPRQQECKWRGSHPLMSNRARAQRSKRQPVRLRV